VTPGWALVFGYVLIGFLRLTLIVYILPRIRGLKEVDDLNQRAFSSLGDGLGPYLLLELVIWPVGLAIGLDLYLRAKAEKRREERARHTFDRIGEPAPGYRELEMGELRTKLDDLRQIANDPTREAYSAPSVFDTLDFHPDDMADRPPGCICRSCRHSRGEA
jgi:hypothetical protein